LFAVTASVHLFTVCRVGSFWDLSNTWFDRADYLTLATMIRHGRFPDGLVPPYFWGFPYAIAGISKLFSIPESVALVLIAMSASLAVCVLVHHLYGGWVATLFIFLNYQWIQLSVEGGSEPLFVLLVYASFEAVRSARWHWAALLASLSATVRPVGVFALLSFAVILARRKSYGQLAATAVIALASGALYVLPLWIVLGSPWGNFSGYQSDWGSPGNAWPLTYPFGALIRGYLAGLHEVRWPNYVMSLAWLGVGVVGGVAIWLPRNRQKFAKLQPEALFASIYILFFISYNSVQYAAWNLPRFFIPVLPLLLFSLRDWIPRDRRVLWTAAVLSALLASAGVVSFRKVFGFKLP